MGYGQGYKYPHAYPEGWAEQEYLPPELKGRIFYQPKAHGLEERLGLWTRKFKNLRRHPAKDAPGTKGKRHLLDLRTGAGYSSKA